MCTGDFERKKLKRWLAVQEEVFFLILKRLYLKHKKINKKKKKKTFPKIIPVHWI